MFFVRNSPIEQADFEVLYLVGRLQRFEPQICFVNPEAPSPPVYLVKTKACRHFARGYCAFGDKCAFAHTVDELRVRPPNLCKTKLCDRGRNCRRPNCGYAHSKAELFHIEPDCPDIKGADDAMSDYYQDLQYIEQLGVMYAAATEKHDKV
ncbi:hypothetical protein Pmar_PMAR022569 [Perkinsus marinus ATCC 50983]|uniref:C3H1-type domain-containing protein n=1 Tax=Perkinsus marinus (strain ATCC 50983 / TXsc) TaxID=423536 RepID=C5KFM5_PERM5|nr:hypothetical protein Pmar_PMAR022569 [Perkinsus marinus ATCC 50983]EER16722.1 hypothetical protein Pmar_PMAR022569 [Perkinsus marinus ATCC 50983]|eukprot:XP_002784926.1 hypothetical protein Pmar_PMAR022569 [Perkinsus marinus ATCC 50983]